MNMLVSLKALLRLTLLTLLFLDALQANASVADALVTLQGTAGYTARPASVMTGAVKTWRVWSAEVMTNLSALHHLQADLFAAFFIAYPHLKLLFKELKEYAITL